MMIYLLIFLLILCMAAFAILAVKHFRQRKALRELCVKVSDILDGGDYDGIGQFQKYTEGEMAVLESQIGKLVILLREQAQGLKEDKAMLKNAMADISHQLKTPMTSLHLIVSMFADETLTDEQRLEYTQHGTMLLNRIDWLVSTFLKLSRFDAGTIEFSNKHVDFEELTDAVVCQIEIPMDLKNQTLVKNIQRNSGFTGDFRWTVEALLNIMKNCVEHTPEGKNLSISATENNLYSEIIIEDEGPGIRPEERTKIFDRFYRGENTSSGSIGIGLALSSDIIRKQNGTIKAESRNEGGARFIIRFHKQIY